LPSNPSSIRECIECGTTFKGRDRRCGTCRYAYAKANSKGPCSQCEQPATVRGMCLTHYTYEYRAKNKHPKVCKVCAKQYTHGRTDSVVCSIECRQTIASAARAVSPNRFPKKSTDLVPRIRVRHWVGQVLPPRRGGSLVSGQCAYCPTYFVGEPGSRYCSDRCANNASWKRRYDRTGGFKVTDKFRLSVYERDNYTCQLCNTHVDVTLHYQDLYSATLDHIIPQSHMLIPDHSIKNLRLAHRICNSIRGDRVAA
jgi:5-methylcytosine-specific restriction endonuclease McrA